MKNKIYLISALLVIAIFGLHGCGTTISDPLGDPPAREATVIRGFLISSEEYADKGKIQFFGREESVEPGALVIVFADDEDGKELGLATADASGSFRVNLNEIPEKNIVSIKAKAFNKGWSNPVRHSWRL